MSRPLKDLSIVLALIVFSILGASCGSGSSTAQLRVVQAIPDAPGNFDVSVDGKSAFTDLAFGSAEPSGGYQPVATGSKSIEVSQTGTSTPLINANVSLVAGTQSTVLLTGLYASPTTVILRDNNTAPVASQAELRVVDASPSAPASLDVYVVSPGTDIAQRQPDISSLQLGQQSVYLDLPTQKSGLTQVEVIVTQSGDLTKTKFVDQIYTLQDGQIRTLVLLDVAGGGALSFSPLELADLN